MLHAVHDDDADWEFTYALQGRYFSVCRRDTKNFLLKKNQVF